MTNPDLTSMESALTYTLAACIQTHTLEHFVIGVYDKKYTHIFTPYQHCSIIIIVCTLKLPFVYIWCVCLCVIIIMKLSLVQLYEVTAWSRNTHKFPANIAFKCLSVYNFEPLLMRILLCIIVIFQINK